MPITPVVHRLELLSQLNLLFPIYVLLIGDIYSMLFFFGRGVLFVLVLYFECLLSPSIMYDLCCMDDI
jgi:hypothetical protein